VRVAEPGTESGGMRPGDAAVGTVPWDVAMGTVPWDATVGTVLWDVAVGTAGRHRGVLFGVAIGVSRSPGRRQCASLDARCRGSSLHIAPVRSQNAPMPSRLFPAGFTEDPGLGLCLVPGEGRARGWFVCGFMG